MNWKVEEIEYLKNNFPYLSDTQLSKQLHKSPNALRIKASRLKIKKYSSIYRENLQLTETERSVIFGGLLGDLHCRIARTSKNARLEGGHSLEQREYLMYKINLLKRLKWYIRKSNSCAYFYQSKSYPCLNSFYELFYTKHKKIVNDDILNNVDSLGLFIWYMDDGCYKIRDKSSCLFTNCFTYDQQFILKDWFNERWNINPTIYYNENKIKYPGKKWYYLYFPVKETTKLHNLFQNFTIPSCMKYKFPSNNLSCLPKSAPGAAVAHN